MRTAEAEAQLLIGLPTEYVDFTGPYDHRAFTFFFRIDDWTFWDLAGAVAKNLELRADGTIRADDFAFAQNKDEQILLYRKAHKNATKITLLTNPRDWMFYAFSLSEFILFETTQTLIEEIETVGFEHQDLKPIEHCTGSLYQYAQGLNTSAYDDNYSEERNKKALSLFFHTAEKEHPEAAHALANHYYFDGDMDVDKVIEWKEKAIAWGSVEDIYGLADFLISHKPERMEQAIALLKSLFDLEWYEERAWLKLSRIFMRVKSHVNHQKGLEYAEACAKRGDYNALADLAYYYYQGQGVEKDVQKAYDLLVQAEKIIVSKTGSGMWRPFIKKLRKELKGDKP
jgi:TPR repeat protein